MHQPSHNAPSSCQNSVYILPSEQLTFFKPKKLKLTLQHLAEKALLNRGFHSKGRTQIESDGEKIIITMLKLR
jgi:hypothetical protein